MKRILETERLVLEELTENHFVDLKELLSNKRGKQTINSCGRKNGLHFEKNMVFCELPHKVYRIKFD